MSPSSASRSLPAATVYTPSSALTDPGIARGTAMVRLDMSDRAIIAAMLSFR